MPKTIKDFRKCTLITELFIAACIILAACNRTQYPTTTIEVEPDVAKHEKLNDYMSGSWDVNGFDIFAEHPIEAGILHIDEFEYRFETSLNRLGMRRTLLEPFMFYHQSGNILCRAFDSELEVVDVTSEDHIPIAECIFEADEKNSQIHLVYLSPDNKLYFGGNGQIMPVFPGAIVKDMIAPQP